jgi:hypothetical protein
MHVGQAPSPVGPWTWPQSDSRGRLSHTPPWLRGCGEVSRPRHSSDRRSRLPHTTGMVSRPRHNRGSTVRSDENETFVSPRCRQGTCTSAVRSAESAIFVSLGRQAQVSPPRSGAPKGRHKRDGPASTFHIAGSCAEVKAPRTAPVSAEHYSYLFGEASPDFPYSGWQSVLISISNCANCLR